MARMTPIKLQILLHCYVSPEHHAQLFDSSAGKEGLAYLANNEMIERYDRTWKTTAKGDFYISHLLDIPFPESVYRIPVLV